MPYTGNDENAPLAQAFRHDPGWLSDQSETSAQHLNTKGAYMDPWLRKEYDPYAVFYRAYYRVGRR